MGGQEVLGSDGEEKYKKNIGEVVAVPITDVAVCHVLSGALSVCLQLLDGNAPDMIMHWFWGNEL